MPAAVRLREDYSAEELRALARRSKDVNQSRRLLSLAGVRDRMDRSAAKIGGMDRQTLRDWVHRFGSSRRTAGNEAGEIWFEDVLDKLGMRARIGQKNGQVRQWAQW
jgi:hypothetical protein